MFAPGHEVPDAYNLWRGFGCEARPGDCSLFLQHVHENVCGGVDEYYQYLMKWMARAVQYPDSPGQVAVVLRGKQGTGKSFLAKVFGDLWGRHFLQVSDPKHLVGNFNSHLRDCVVLFGDEAFYAGDKKHESVLKTLITEETITIEAKGVDAEAAPNFIHLMLASNSDWVVPAGAEERRFFVLDVGDARRRDSDFFRKVKGQLDDGGREALLHHLMTMDLSDFDVRRVPETEALAEQKHHSLGPEEEWWFQKLWEGRLMQDHIGWKCEVEKEELTADYVAHCQRFNITRRGNATRLGKFLSRVCPDGYPKSAQRYVERDVPTGDGWVRKKRVRPYFHVFPALAECRRRWDELYSTKTDWPQEEEPQEELGEPTEDSEAAEPF